MKDNKLLKDIRCSKCGRLLCRASGELEIKCKCKNTTKVKNEMKR